MRLPWKDPSARLRPLGALALATTIILHTQRQLKITSGTG